MRGLDWLQRGWAAVKRMYPALVAALVVAALAATLYGVSQARQRAHVSGTASSASAATVTATETATLAATATTQPPLSGPTPTVPSGGQQLVPSNGTASFIVQAVTIEADCQYSVGVCDAHTICPTTLYINGFAWLPKNAPDGYVTYRWHLSDGTITAPANAHYSWDDKYGQNLIVYKYSPNPAIADGRPFWAQLEIMKPNEMISQRSGTYTIVCVPLIEGVSATASQATPLDYNCAAGGTQTYSATASATLSPSPSFSFQYYWKRSDGSVSPTYTATTTGGATSVSLHGDTMSVTASTPPGAFSDSVVIPHPPALPGQTAGPTGGYVTFGYKSCAASTPPPTPTATPAPTATPLPTATATP